MAAYHMVLIAMTSIVLALGWLTAPITALQDPVEPEPPTPLEVLVETVGGRLDQDDEGRAALPERVPAAQGA